MLFAAICLHADTGHDLWLRNKKPLPVTVNVVNAKNTETITIAKKELEGGWQGKAGTIFSLIIKNDKAVQADGFRLRAGSVQANTELGLLYGVYELLRRQQTGEPVKDEASNPSYEVRILNHWDNPDGSVEFYTSCFYHLCGRNACKRILIRKEKGVL